ncbi:hypothetical protein DSM14862_03751 (plasmid) [Sulfitobacter indolifex]|uniref:Uncharacterized protein n=1 Tax=Sulfitobacter indolifex HEL-45 TaxID=391624 RepID=A0ABM9X047_9RHOB|nr:hypothetical protein [Sulfitobacter indolifex]EDQ02853.1 hypothetical protein OIHEL45_19976 [Sulfitobacter indolifex HEL-45]UOA20518.1 hypothetical protein DSM14862_03356 [Sulfitobacter indolifex]UOA20913.1 hypothetical protein DSM14862_03751 [Sulfitobacter indolifex]
MQVFVASLEQCLKSENWPAALCLALSLPDMAGAIENPEAKPQKRYAQWFDRWVGPKYRTNVLSGQHAFLSGAECYALKCAMLYQGFDADNGRRKDAIDAFYRFHFTSVATEHCEHKNRTLQLHTDRFCRDVGEGCEAWLKSIKNDARKSAALNRALKIAIPL